MEYAISLEETNALRKSLGLRPITVESTENADDVKAWEAKKQQDQQAARATETREKIEQVNDRIRTRKVLAGKKAPETHTTSSWLQKMRKSKSDAMSNPATDGIDAPAATEPIAPRKPQPKAIVHLSNVEDDPSFESEKGNIHSEPSKEDRFDMEFDPLDKEDSAPVGPQETDFEVSKAKFKPKKRKSHNRRQLEAADYELNESIAFQDDSDDLYKVLAENRRLKQNQLKDPEQIAEQVLQTEEPVEETSKGIVVSGTADFLLKLKKNKNLATDETERLKPHNNAAVHESPTQTTFLEPDADQESEPEVALVSGGLAATLNLLKQRGVVKPDSDSRRKRKNHEWLQKVASQRLQREIELRQQQDAVSHLPAKQRAELLELQDQQNVKEEVSLAKRQFENYTPVVNLEHRDDEGNLLSAKDAFKHLSHKFHGNAEGKKRAKKRMSGRELAKEELSKSVFD